MSHKVNIRKILMTFCIAVLMCFMFSIVFKLFVRMVLVKHFNMNNTFTQIVFWGNEELNNAGMDDPEIDWGALYPFTEDNSKIETESPNLNVLPFQQYTRMVDSIKSKIDKYSNQNLFGYSKITEWAKGYDSFLEWNFAPYSEYNGVMALDDGYLTEFIEETDMTENAKSVIELNQYCKDRNIDFLYIQAPYKISKYDDIDISGKLDFSNQNADALLDRLSDAEVPTYDLREEIYKGKLKHHELFYRTDHHWLPTTGLWASEKISEYCNDHYNFHIDTSLMDIDNFKVVEYSKWFLGSQGKKVTLSRIDPDDFSLLYPNIQANFHYVIPSKDIDKEGDFSITYDLEQVKEKNYYKKNPYAAYNYGDQPLIQIENRLKAEEKKILLVKDSFSDCVSSFLALGVKQVDVIDLRHFKGSLRTYINLSKPDLMIVMYNPDNIVGKINWTVHTSLFDFR